MGAAVTRNGKALAHLAQQRRSFTSIPQFTPRGRAVHSTKGACEASLALLPVATFRFDRSVHDHLPPLLIVDVVNLYILSHCIYRS